MASADKAFLAYEFYNKHVPVLIILTTDMLLHV